MLIRTSLECGKMSIIRTCLRAGEVLVVCAYLCCAGLSGDKAVCYSLYHALLTVVVVLFQKSN